MTTPSFRDNRRKYDMTLRQIEQFSEAEILIGFQEGSITRSQTKKGRKKKPGLSMPQIAAQNEFGTDKIPARSFMRTSFDENRDKIRKAIDIQYDRVLNGEETVKKALNILGLFGVDLIQKKIREIQYPPNSPLTIAIKGSSKPLIDFGQMIQSVRHKVVFS